MGNHRVIARGLATVACCLVCSACSRPVGVGAHGNTGSIRVTHAVAWSAADVKAATVGMEISNGGDAFDTLIAVTSPAGAAMLHTEASGQGMRPVPVLPLAPRASIRIGRGLHVMVESLKDVPATGSTIPLTLRFARAGSMDLSVPVLRYSEALSALGE
jgi:copper(I)-binding protein